jgi:Putative motility protein
MDMSLVTSILMAQAGNTQMQVATSVMKSNMDAEKSAVQTLLGISPPTANLGAGVGGNLNITA